MEFKATLQGALNLAPDPLNPEILRPVRVPSRISSATGRVLCQIHHSGGTSLVVNDGSSVTIVNSLTGRQELTLTISDTIHCATAGSGDVLIFTDRGPYLVTYDSDRGWVDMGYEPQWPAVVLTRHSTATYQATMMAAELHGPYEHGEGPLAKADAESIADDVTDAYQRLVADAAQGGYLVQPALMSYRLLDRQGGVIYESSPVLVSAEGGFQLTSTVDLDVNDGRTQRGGCNLTVDGWRPGVMLAEALGDDVDPAWASRVAALEVLASPQIHPLNYNLNCTGRISSSGVLSFNFPGAAASPSGSEQRCSLVRRVLEHAQSLMEVVDHIPDPFSGGLTPGEVRQVNLSPGDDAREQTRSMHATFNKTTRSTSVAAYSLQAFPHRFTATAVARQVDSVVYANPRVLPFSGHSLQSMCHSLMTTAGGWKADVVVQLGDGSRQVVWSGKGASAAPLLLSPLLTYPSADAVKMTIHYYSPSGRFSRHELPLKGVPAMGVAYYLHPSLVPWSPAPNSTAWTTPESTQGAVAYDGCIATAQASGPLIPTQLKRVAPSTIADVKPASSASSGFMSGNPHFYVASADGITMVTTSTDSASVTRASLIDRRGVTAAGSLCVGADCCYAIAGGALLRLDGTKVKVLIASVAARQPGWTSYLGGELWMLGIDGQVMVYHPAAGCISRRECSGEALWSDGDTLYVSDKQGLRRVASRDLIKWTDNTVHVEVSAVGVATRRSGMVDVAEVPMSGSSVDATVDVFGTNHAGKPDGLALPQPARLLRFSVSGKYVTRPGVTFRHPRRRNIYLKINANVSDDTIIEA